MIDLKMFPKLGVRVPLSLKRRVKQLALDLEKAGVSFQSEEVTMEAIFAGATLYVLAMDPRTQVSLFSKHLPELIAMFEAETPRDDSKETPGEAGAGGGSKPKTAMNSGGGSARARKGRGVQGA